MKNQWYRFVKEQWHDHWNKSKQHTNFVHIDHLIPLDNAYHLHCLLFISQLLAFSHSKFFVLLVINSRCKRSKYFLKTERKEMEKKNSSNNCSNEVFSKCFTSWRNDKSFLNRFSWTSIGSSRWKSTNESMKRVRRIEIWVQRKSCTIHFASWRHFSI